MVHVRFVTIQGCREAQCVGCATAERIVRRAAKLAGADLPKHDPAGRGEAHFSDGRIVEAEHLSCDDAWAQGLDPERAPYLFVDGELLMEKAGMDTDRLSRVLLRALFPEGMPRP